MLSLLINSLYNFVDSVFVSKWVDRLGIKEDFRSTITKKQLDGVQPGRVNQQYNQQR